MRSIVLLGALIIACPGPAPLPPPRVCSGVTPAPSNPSIAIRGEPVIIEFELAAACEAATSIDTVVLDPADNEVESTTTLEGHVGRVAFTPTQQGAYRVVVRMQPNRGTASTQLLVAIDRRADVGLPVSLPEAELLGAELTAARRLLCPATRRVHTLDGTGAVVDSQQLPGEELQIADDVAWTATGGNFMRFVPSGDAGYLRSPDVVLTVDAGPWFPTRDDVWVTRPDEITAAAAGSSAFGITEYRVGYVHTADLHRVGARLMINMGNTGCAVDPADGGYECSSPIPGRIQFSGGDTSGYWLRVFTSTGESIERHRSPAVQVGMGVLLVPGTLHDPTGVRSALPQFEQNGLELVAAEGDGGIVLERWGNVISATQSTVIVRSDAGVSVHRR